MQYLTLLYVAVFVIHRSLILYYIGAVKRNEKIDPYSELRDWIMLIGACLLLVQWYIVKQYIKGSQIFSGSVGGDIVLGHLLYSFGLWTLFNYANIEKLVKDDETMYNRIYSMVRGELVFFVILEAVSLFSNT